MPAGCQLEATPPSCDTILRHVFSAIPDMLNVIDRDFNIIMSNWHESGMVPEEARRGQPKCYQVYHHRDRPCERLPCPGGLCHRSASEDRKDQSPGRPGPGIQRFSRPE